MRRLIPCHVVPTSFVEGRATRSRYNVDSKKRSFLWGCVFAYGDKCAYDDFVYLCGAAWDGAAWRVVSRLSAGWVEGMVPSSVHAGNVVCVEGGRPLAGARCLDACIAVPAPIASGACAEVGV